MNSKMLFEKPVREVITKRTSVRTYLNQAMTEYHRTKLIDFFTYLDGPFNIGMRFKLIDSDAAQGESQAKLGTYGVIKGATTFLAGSVEKKDKNLEQFGYIFEKVILYATSLGLGTCWLGGSFKKSEFAKAINLGNDEILPCVSPIGYPGKRKSIIESVMRFSAGSNNRKDWNELFFRNDFSRHLPQSESGKYQPPLEMIRLAPSASNKQPWRVVQDKNNYHFYLEHTKGYAKILAHDLQRVDMGIAMCHFELTAKETGINGNWQISDPGINTPQDTEYIVSWVELPD